MRIITIVTVLMILLPMTVAQSICTDMACLDMSLRIWEDMGCFEKICNQGLGVNEEESCYNTLCQDHYDALTPDCQIELCNQDVDFFIPEDAPLENDPVDDEDNFVPTQQSNNQDNVPVQQQTPTNDAQVNELQESLDSCNNELDSLNTRINNLESQYRTCENSLNDAKSKEQELLSPTKKIFPFMYVILGVIILGLLIFNVVNMAKISKLKKPKLRPEQINQIRNYFYTYMGKGYSAESIKQGLLNQGWTEEQINQANKNKSF